MSDAVDYMNRFTSGRRVGESDTDFLTRALAKACDEIERQRAVIEAARKKCRAIMGGVTTDPIVGAVEYQTVHQILRALDGPCKTCGGDGMVMVPGRDGEPEGDRCPDCGGCDE